VPVETTRTRFEPVTPPAPTPAPAPVPALARWQGPLEDLLDTMRVALRRPDRRTPNGPSPGASSRRPRAGGAATTLAGGADIDRTLGGYISPDDEEEDEAAAAAAARAAREAAEAAEAAAAVRKRSAALGPALAAARDVAVREGQGPEDGAGPEGHAQQRGRRAWRLDEARAHQRDHADASASPDPSSGAPGLSRLIPQPERETLSEYLALMNAQAARRRGVLDMLLRQYKAAQALQWSQVRVRGRVPSRVGGDARREGVMY